MDANGASLLGSRNWYGTLNNVNNFDFVRFFDENDIKYRTSGKNIGGGAGWVGIEFCPRCGKDNYHAAVNTKSAKINCWGCGGFNLPEFLKLTLKCDYRTVNKILKQYELEPQEILNNIESQESQEEHVVKNYKLPSTFVDTFPDEAKKYLKDRGFDYLELVKKYGIKWTSEFGRAKYRVAFPIIMDNKVVSYGARTIINDSQIIPYMYERDTEAGMQRKELLFGLNHVFLDKAILVEGIFDSVNLGFGAVALLSKWFSTFQILRLKQAGIKNFYMMPDNNDPGSIKSFKKLESNLVWADDIRYIEYDSEDPGSLNKSDVKLLRRMIF